MAGGSRYGVPPSAPFLGAPLLAGGDIAPTADSVERGKEDVKRRARPRAYDIDWMRVTSIYLVVTYHVVQGLDWVGFYNNIPGMRRFVVHFRASALQTGMPMFFHISGRAQALSTTTGLIQTFVRRAQRLLLPFAVCYVLLIPPWQYIDKEYDWQHPSSFHMLANPIEWLTQYWTSARFLMYFDMAWLWFLPALYVIILFCTPLFLLGERFKADRMQKTYVAVAMLLWGGLAAALVAIGFSRRFAFFAVAGPTSAVLVARWVPVPGAHGCDGLESAPSPSSPPSPTPAAVQMWAATHVLTAIQILCSIGVVLNFGYGEIDPPQSDGGHDPRAAMPFIILCMAFYVHGFFLQRWRGGSDLVDRSADNSWLWPWRIGVFFSIILTSMVSAPLGDVESGHFIYPIYSTTYDAGAGFGAIHVLGTWVNICIFSALFEAYCNGMGWPSFHRHATSSTIVVYIFHWVFIKIFAFWWLNPTLWEHGWVVKTAWVALLVTAVAFVVCVALSLSIYLLLVLRAPRLGALFGL